MEFVSGLLAGVAIVDYTRAQEQAKTKAEPITRKIPPKKDTVIFRYGKSNPSNLTPKEKDYKTGLSFSTIPSRTERVMTTINTINSTGILQAIQDKPFHVSVKPVGSTVKTWGDAGTDSIWTKTLKAVVIKWDGGN